MAIYKNYEIVSRKTANGVKRNVYDENGIIIGSFNTEKEAKEFVDKIYNENVSNEITK